MVPANTLLYAYLCVSTSGVRSPRVNWGRGDLADESLLVPLRVRQSHVARGRAACAACQFHRVDFQGKSYARTDE
eukprot:scaffold195407_cov27-Prasinocladus_malaysianus.AAC.3